MNAIILAAGRGTRMGDVTDTVPKPLVRVNGKPIIETQIQCLHEKGIKNIIVIVGYLKEKFYYLKEKYEVEFVENDRFGEFNNIYSMYLAKNYLEDSYVLEGDVFINNNFIDENISESKYFSVCKEKFLNEWVIITDKQDKVVDVDIRDGSCEHILSGICHLSKNDGLIVGKLIEEKIKSGKFEGLYWDNVVVDNLKSLNLKIQRLKSNDCFEIDTFNELKEVEEYLINGEKTNE
ncbi:CTP--phosphocholine cytidylyltransferase [Clostridium ihumii]|uniref:CTP--phosphocholine cytidylyltransferase n=1 Tax=Clostridium ihumii TaxID=1470356 RepID=UPI00058B3EAB|nr:CTP--phosphocholine cytidylyltransferase [Clostridium ihumii]